MKLEEIVLSSISKAIVLTKDMLCLH